MKNKLIKPIFTILLVFVSKCAFSQSYPEVFDHKRHRVYGMFPKNVVQLTFRSNSTPSASFLLGFSESRMKGFTISNNQSTDYYLGNQTSVLFEICTAQDKGCNSYKINGGNSYKIYWNSNKIQWDLIQLK